jgi:hypothetical protein
MINTNIKKRQIIFYFQRDPEKECIYERSLIKKFLALVENIHKMQRFFCYSHLMTKKDEKSSCVLVGGVGGGGGFEVIEYRLIFLNIFFLAAR